MTSKAELASGDLEAMAARIAHFAEEMHHAAGRLEVPDAARPGRRERPRVGTRSVADFLAAAPHASTSSRCPGRPHGGRRPERRLHRVRRRVPGAPRTARRLIPMRSTDAWVGRRRRGWMPVMTVRGTPVARREDRALLPAAACSSPTWTGAWPGRCTSPTSPRRWRTPGSGASTSAPPGPRPAWWTSWSPPISRATGRSSPRWDRSRWPTRSSTPAMRRPAPRHRAGPLRRGADRRGRGHRRLPGGRRGRARRGRLRAAPGRGRPGGGAGRGRPAALRRQRGRQPGRPPRGARPAGRLRRLRGDGAAAIVNNRLAACPLETRVAVAPGRTAGSCTTRRGREPIRCDARAPAAGPRPRPAAAPAGGRGHGRHRPGTARPTPPSPPRPRTGDLARARCGPSGATTRPRSSRGRPPGAAGRRLRPGPRPRSTAFDPDVVLDLGRRPVRELPRGPRPALRARSPTATSRPDRGRRRPSGRTCWGEAPDDHAHGPGPPRRRPLAGRGSCSSDGSTSPTPTGPCHHPSLPHAFLNTVLSLDYQRGGFPWPVVAMPINCTAVGSIRARGGLAPLRRWTSTRPAVALARAAHGRGRRRRPGAWRASPWRVALVASSSWSHAFLTDHTWRLRPDTPADRRLYEALVGGDVAALGVDDRRPRSSTPARRRCSTGSAPRARSGPVGARRPAARAVETWCFNSNTVVRRSGPAVSAGAPSAPRLAPAGLSGRSPRPPWSWRRGGPPPPARPRRRPAGPAAAGGRRRRPARTARKRKVDERFAGPVPAAQLGQRDGLQRAVHHQAGVALDPGGVGAVVVDPVRVVGEGREAEQQPRVDGQLLLPAPLGLAGPPPSPPPGPRRRPGSPAWARSAPGRRCPAPRPGPGSRRSRARGGP